MMRENLTKVLLCVVAFHFIGLGRAQSVPVTMREPLSIAMQATGAEVNKVYIVGNGRVTMKGGVTDGLKRIVEESARMLGVEKGSYEIEERASDARRSVSLFSGKGTTQTMIWAKQRTEEVTGKNDVELIVKIVEKSPEEKDIIGHRDRIYATIQNFKSTPRITTCLEGYLDGKLRKDEWALYLRDAFDAIGAGIHTVTDSGAYMSYTGYSPLIWDEGITVGGDQININMAMRYHSFDQRTYIVIGSPVITVEY